MRESSNPRKLMTQLINGQAPRSQHRRPPPRGIKLALGLVPAKSPIRICSGGEFLAQERALGLGQQPHNLVGNWLQSARLDPNQFPYPGIES
jgi:hypothetical protein